MNFKKIVAGFLVGVVSLFLFNAKAFAQDSGPGTWDFLLFANANIGASVLGESIPSTGTVVNPSLQKMTEPGYGLGFGTEYWFSDKWAARLLVQGNIFANGTNNLKDGPFFGMAPITIGAVYKLAGSQNYFVYAPLDLGYAMTFTSGPLSGSTPGVVQGGSLYGDVGIGANIRFIMIEAKAAYLMTTNTYTGAMLYFPLTVGFDF